MHRSNHSTGTRPRSRRSLIVGLGLALGVTLASVTMVEWVPQGEWIPLFLGLAVIGAAGVSLRWPVAGAVATGTLLAILLLLPEGAHGVAVNLALVPVGAFAARGRPWVAAAVAGVFMVLLVADVLRGAPTVWEAAPYTAGWLLLFTISALVGQLVMRTAEVARAQRDLELGEQRRLIARELHDTVAQELTMLVMRGEQARGQGAATLDLNHVLDVCRGTLADMRAILDVLHADHATHLRGPHTIASLVERARSRLAEAGFRVDVMTDAEDADRAPVARTAVAGVLREAVSNVIRHGDPGYPVKMFIGCADGRLEAIMINAVAPHPADVAHHQSLGVAGMRERVTQAGGVLEATSSGTEWILRVDLPMDVIAETQEQR